VGQASGDKADIFFAQSSNGGTTWTTPIKVNNDTTTNDQWQPALAVTPDGTHIFITWYDRRNDTANSLIDRFGVIGSISGSTVTFGSNFQITTADAGKTTTSFPAVVGQDPAIVSDYMGDYDVATADNSFFYTTWGDNRLSDASHTNQPDVRFEKISTAGVIQFAPIASTPASAAAGSTSVPSVAPSTAAVRDGALAVALGTPPISLPGTPLASPGLGQFSVLVPSLTGESPAGLSAAGVDHVSTAGTNTQGSSLIALGGASEGRSADASRAVDGFIWSDAL
jgi:hypothetical protein